MMKYNKPIKMYLQILIYITSGILGSGTLHIKGYLCDKGEWANNISLNDPLNYGFTIDKNNNYKENCVSIVINPFNQYLYSDSAKLRKKSIKNIDAIKLEHRFNEIKQFILSHQSDWHNNYKDVIKNKLA